jgi:hypothetical protein
MQFILLRFRNVPNQIRPISNLCPYCRCVSRRDTRAAILCTYTNRTDRIGDARSSQDQHINLPQLSDDLSPLVTLAWRSILLDRKS